MQPSAVKPAYTLTGKRAIILLLLIFAAFYLPFLLSYGWQYRNIDSVDLPSFYAASISAFSFGESPYDPTRLQSLMKPLYAFPFVYPPPSLLVFFPLSLLSYETARYVVLIANHVMLLMLAWTIPLQVLKARPSTHFFSIAVCLVYSLWSYPVMLTLNHGQINLLLLLCLVLFWLCSRKECAPATAFFLALAILLKTYPVILLPMLMLTGRKRESVFTLLWLGLAVATSLAIFPLSVWNDWITQVLPSSGYLKTPLGLFSPAIPININVNGFFARNFTSSEWSQPLVDNPALGRLLAYLTAGVVLAATATTVWQNRAQPYALDRAILVSLPAMFLIAPFSWEHHVVYLLPCILAVLSGRYRGIPVRKLMFHLSGIVAALVLAVDGCMAYKFPAVLVLWLLCLFIVRSRHIELPMFDKPLPLQKSVV